MHRAPIGSYRSVIVQSAAMKVTHERDKNSGKENLATISLDLPNFHFQSNIFFFESCFHIPYHVPFDRACEVSNMACAPR